MGTEDSLSRKAFCLEGEGFVNVIDEKYKYTLFDGKQKGEMINIITSKPEIAKSLNLFIPDIVFPNVEDVDREFQKPIINEKRAGRKKL